VPGRVYQGFCAYDDATGELDEVVSCGESLQLVRVPGGFWHGFRALGSEPARLVYFTNRLYDAGSPDELRRPWDDPSVVPRSINGRSDDRGAADRGTGSTCSSSSAPGGWLRMHILVTGGLGFIGSNFIRLMLEGGYSVTNLDNLSYGSSIDSLRGVEPNPKYRLFRGDICDAPSSRAS